MKKLVFLVVVLVGLGVNSIAQSKVAHINTQVLWDTLPSSKVALKKYSQIEKEAYDQLNAMNSEFQTNVEKYRSEQNSMSQTTRELEEKRLIEMQQKIEETNQSLKNYLATVSNDLNAPLEDLIKRAVDIVAARNRLSYVFDVSTAIYSGGGEDITNEVIDQLLLLDQLEQGN